MSNGHFSADSPQKSVSSRRIVTVAVICVLALALAAVGFFLVRPALDPYHCRMADGVSIAGVDVGGMTKGRPEKPFRRLWTRRCPPRRGGPTRCRPRGTL